ncbi:Uncharacterised protein [Shimwellia blattae]|nr:Uncharacterised protein [Shimwellia blattae]VEC22150.1 Uncharacterised protein [Shimwellia blattae]
MILVYFTFTGAACQTKIAFPPLLIHPISVKFVILLKVTTFLYGMAC